MTLAAEREERKVRLLEILVGLSVFQAAILALIFITGAR